MAVVSELVTKFSFVGSLTPQENFNSNLKMSVGLLAGAGAAMAVAAGGFFAWTAGVLDSLDPLAQLNRETGVGVEAIQELGYVATVTGSSSEAMSASLAQLSKSTGDAARGIGRGKKAFEDLGISVTDSAGKVKTADVVLDELRGRFAALGTSMGEQKSIIASLGIDATLLQTLNLTNAEMAALTEKARGLGVVTKEQADAAAEFNDSLATLKFGMESVKNQVAVGFAPAMTALTDKFIGFLETNKDLIQHGLTVLGNILSSTMGFMQRMAPIVLFLAAAFGVAWLAAGGFAKVLAFAMSPVVLITAGILALLLIVDDLMVAFSGGQSVIADFFNEFFGIDIATIMHGIVDAFNDMVAAVMDVIGPFIDAIGQTFSAIFKLFTGDFSGALDSLSGAFSSWTSGMSNVFGVFVSAISAAFGLPLVALKAVIGESFAIISPFIDAIGQLFTGIVQAFSGDFSGALDSLKGAFSSWIDGIKGVFSGLFDFLSGAWAEILSGIANGAMSILPDWAVKLLGGKSAPVAPMPAPAPVAPVAAIAPMPRPAPDSAAPLTPMAAMNIGGNTSSTSNSSINQQVEIRVSSTDPKAAGAAVNNALQDQLKTAKTQVNRGGR